MIKHINEDGTMVKIQQLDNGLTEHKTAGCSHPFGPEGTTTPANEVWNFPPVQDDDADIPGYSIKEWHWERDKKFEERLMVHYSRMASDKFGGANMDNYKREYGDALKGIRSNNKYHLERIFKKAYEEIYMGGDWDAQENQSKLHDRTVKTFLATDGVLHARA